MGKKKKDLQHGFIEYQLAGNRIIITTTVAQTTTTAAQTTTAQTWNRLIAYSVAFQDFVYCGTV